MKKIILGAIALLMTCSAAFADEVPASVTRQAAANFWNTYRTADAKPVDAADLQQMTYAGLEHLVVYANGEQGFILMSSDDNARPVLAYSFETPFPEELFPTLRYWLMGYESQIAEATEPSPKTKAEWKSLLTDPVPPTPKTLLDVPKMVTTYWNQSAPYNNLCPYDSNYHDRTVVGCVATAMAQIMRFWNHPSCGVGSHCYTYHQYGTLCADFANTTYIWQYMPERVDAMSSREREIKAVATLSYHCGVSVDMMYGPSATGGSGAYSHDVVEALTNYFRYDPSTMEHHYRGYNTDSAWRVRIDADIEAGRPVYYTGRDSSGGHAFVLDGSDTTGRYHFNLGWGGYGDGFYTVDNIAPGSGGAGGNATYTFNLSQSAIFGIKPIPQQFDTVDYYDTVCYTSMYYIFHDYYEPPTEGEYYLTYLDTVYHVQVAVAPKRFIHYDPNGAEGATQTRDYCYISGAKLSPCPFERPGYHFVGWCLDIHGNDVLYQPGDTLHIRTTKIIYAIWAPGGVGIEETTAESINMWPNPTSDELNLRLTSVSDAQIRIFDAMGRIVDQHTVAGESVKIRLDGLPAGTYTVQVSTSTGIYNRRVIKR